MSYPHIYHYALTVELETLPYVDDLDDWNPWAFTNEDKCPEALTEEERNELNQAGSEYEARKTLRDIFRRKGIKGLRYINAVEFPGTSILLFDKSALQMPEQGFNRTYGKSFEDDYEEAWEAIHDDPYYLSQYAIQMARTGNLHYWHRYINEFDETIKAHKEDIDQRNEDPDDEDNLLESILWTNTISEEAVEFAVKATKSYEQIHHSGWDWRNGPTLELRSLTGMESKLAHEIV